MIKKVKTKKEVVSEYLQSNPGATIAQVAEACGCSAPTVSEAKRELGLTGKRKVEVSPAALPAPAVSGADLEHIKTALTQVKGATQLMIVLEAVEEAGGIAVVRSKLEEYNKMKEILG